MYLNNGYPEETDWRFHPSYPERITQLADQLNPIIEKWVKQMVPVLLAELERHPNRQYAAAMEGRHTEGYGFSEQDIHYLFSLMVNRNDKTFCCVWVGPKHEIDKQVAKMKEAAESDAISGNDGAIVEWRDSIGK